MMYTFDLPKLQELLRSFHILTGVRIVVFDDQFQEIVTWPLEHNPFCRLLRTDPAADRLCGDSDRQACLHSMRTGAATTYRCHAGLTETVMPIRHDHMVIGYLMFGQVLLEESEPEHYGGALGEALEQTRRLGEEQLGAAAQILEACAGYLWLSRLVQLSEDSPAYRLKLYLAKHLERNVPIRELCDYLEVSKTKLYAISNHSFGMGVRELVQELRIQQAKRLLEDTELAVGRVAAAVGIPDYNYFTKVFRKCTGMPPSHYRRAARKGAKEPLEDLTPKK